MQSTKESIGDEAIASSSKLLEVKPTKVAA